MYTAATGGHGGVAGGALIISHGANSLTNGVTDFNHIFSGEWENVGKTNYLKDNVYKPLGKELAGDLGESIGEVAFYIVDIAQGVKGTTETIKALKIPRWQRGTRVMKYSLHGTSSYLKDYKNSKALYMIVVKDGMGYMYDVQGYYNDLNKDEEVDAISGAAPVYKIVYTEEENVPQN